MERQQAWHIIETLRSGVPSREVSSVLTEGQASVLGRVHQDLSQVARGEHSSLIVRGQYGEGKSHLLSTIENIARGDRFAVSNIVLSKETPFNRINKVYEAVAHAVMAPDLPRAGFEDILMRLRSGTDRTEDIIEYSERCLHPKIAYIFRNYLREGDILKRAQLYDDLTGSSITMANLRAIHRGNFHQAVSMPRFLIPEHTLDYFRWLGFLLRRSGYQGWVILLDEAELIGKLGLPSRAQAYVNLAQLLGLDARRPALDGIYVVLALASPFVQEVLSTTGRNDLTKVPEWFTDPRRNKSTEIAPASAAMGSLVEASVPLEPLSEANMQDILESLEEYHNLAYQWAGHLDREFVKTKSLAQPGNSTRTIIRAALEYLDLFFQYKRPPDIEVRPADTERFVEDDRYNVDEDPDG